MQHHTKFNLHGDNIVECERTVDLIIRSMGDLIDCVRGPYGSPVCPSYDIKLSNTRGSIFLTLYPGFGRWNHDILALIRSRGGTLREAADTIVTAVSDHHEVPLMALEYCGALPAGNQAWQRNGRAYSFGKAEVPYVYVAELAGYELGENRVRKATRLPNPAVPFSYVAFSLTNPTSTLPVFVSSPGAPEALRVAYANAFGEIDLLAFVRSVLLGEKLDTTAEGLRLKALSFVETKAGSSRAGETLTPTQWQNVYDAMQRGQNIVSFLVTSAPMRWAKKAYIAGMTSSARALMDATASLAIGLTSSTLPMCIVPKKNRLNFAQKVEQLYAGRIHPDFLSWLRRDDDLTICWVMGFKPRGDDARPDRGLPPFARMLIGDKEDLLTVVYGPASSATWSRLHTTPKSLLANGLWEAILEASDAILVDSSTDRTRHHGYLRPHWYEERARPDLDMILVKPRPLRIGENDVDTALHLMLGRLAKTSIFEGMCNPPGGDWSGVSLQSIDRAAELRWLTLPRVSETGAKRPDHVFQLFKSGHRPIVLCVESKETAASVEPGIGPRLISYIKALMLTPASIERTAPSAPWAHSTTVLKSSLFTIASAVAFLEDVPVRVAAVKERAKVDLLMCFSFVNNGDSCSVRLIATTALGRHIATQIESLSLQGCNISVITT